MKFVSLTCCPIFSFPRANGRMGDPSVIMRYLHVFFNPLPYSIVKKLIAFSFSFFLSSCSLNAQVYIEWQKSFGSTGTDQGSDIHQLSDGTFIITGLIGANDGDATNSRGQGDVWLAKLDNQGSIIWKKNYGSTQGDNGDVILSTSDGGYIFVAYGKKNDGDINSLNSNNRAGGIWLVKTDSQGDIQWQKGYGGSSGSGDGGLGSKLITTTGGGYILFSWVTSTDGDLTGSGNHGAGDYWVAKLSATGVIQWQKCYGGSSSESTPSNIIQTSDGGYAFIGHSQSTNGDLTSNAGDYDVWVVKLSSTGSIQWQKTLGGTKLEWGEDIIQNSDGSFTILASTRSNDGDVSGNNGLQSIWIVKLNSTGVLQWQKCYGGSLDFGAKIVAIAGGYMVAGTKANNYWIFEIDSTGNKKWERDFGGTGTDIALAMDKTTDGGCIATGYSNSNDGNVSGNHGSFDMWTVKFKPCPSITKSIDTTIATGSTYRRPSGLVVSISGTYIDTLAAFNGCDSIVTTRLSVANPCRARDSLALVGLYNATGGANWTTKWNLALPMTTWFGVTLNAQGCVSCLDLDGVVDCGYSTNTSGNNLVGTLPTSLDSLQNLIGLQLAFNRLTGSIPNLTLPNVEELYLSNNQLTGAIPNLNLPSVKRLSLNHNQLSGTIPNLTLPSVEQLSLNNNQLSGAIPNFNLPNAFLLNLYVNQLSGTIPNLNLPKMQYLFLSTNKFTGSIPNFNNLPQLIELYLNENQLTGSMPNFSLPKLQRLYVYENQLSGTIPNLKLGINTPLLTDANFSSNKFDSCAVFSNLSSMSANNLSINRLTFDDILPNISQTLNIYNLQDSFFVDTTITATIGGPLSINLKIDGALTSNQYKWFKNGVLQSVYTSNSNKLVINSLQATDAGVWTCQVINSAAPLLILFSRKITIQVSAKSCRTRDSLALVDLYNATGGANWTVRDTLNQKSPWQLPMPITTWFGIRVNAAGCVTGIDLDGKLDYEQLGTIPGNNLVGTIPSLDSLTNLTGLFLTSNQLRGTIPNFNLPNLQYLALNENLLSGGIPNFNLPNLQYLALTDNNLSGSIPNFDKLPQLKYLYIGNDHLTGTISDFNKLPNLLVLGCGGNSLTGTIPDFSNLSSVATLYLNNNQLTGSIPNFSNLPNLNELIIENNQLSGSIPNFNLPRLGTLYLKNNKLTGCIPTSIKTNCPNIGATGGDIALNTGLNTQSWANYWNNGEGACTNCTATATRQTLTPSVCLGQTYRSPSGKTFTTAGTKLDTVKNRIGCDSILFSINLTILTPQNQQAATQSVCKGDVFRGKILTRDTVFRDTIRSVALCDSVITTTPVKVNIASVNNINLSLCSGGSSTVNGIVYNAGNRSGQQIIRAATAAGCDSIINITTSFVANLSAIDDEYTVRDSSNILNFNVLDNDFYSGNVSVTPLSKPLIGRLDSLGIGRFRYTIPPQANGTAGFSYRLCSVACPNLCDTGLVKIIINRPRLNIDVSLGITPNCGCQNEKLLFPELVLNPDKYPANELTVVSRWGDVVFRAKPYKNDWSGANDAGQVLPAGTYYYIMRLDLANSLIKTGDITIYR